MNSDENDENDENDVNDENDEQVINKLCNYGINMMITTISKVYRCKIYI